MKNGHRKRKGDSNGQRDFGWKSADYFGTREAGEAAAFSATPSEWIAAYYAEADKQKADGFIVTTHTVVPVVGRPPGNPSRIGATHGAWVRTRKLKPTGVEKANDRHQGHHYTW